MTTTIYLARHGVTMANQENRFAGRSDEPLHPEGAEQVAEVGRALAAKAITAIYCGPLPRTR
ncbi:MAG: histidine phosphatase family protein, partial [Desulfobulbaceae bacterium]|nr:histidine phosphatase family protein [Desulfobulbaceae bacterium]